MRAILWDDATQGMTFSYGPVPDELLATAQQWREKMVSAAAEASDELMDKYLETGELDEAEIVAGLRQRTVKGEIQAVLCGSAFKNKGVQRMLDAVVELMPSPLDIPAIQGVDEQGQPAERHPSDDEPLSALAFQFVNDLPGVLAQIRRALRPDGLLLAAMIGGDTLTELRQSFAAAEAECEGGVSPRVAPFADLRDIGGLLQRAGFALPVTDVDRVVVRYASAFGLMHDLRRMGAANSLVERRRTPLRRATLLRMAEIYSERFADADGRIRATFDIIWISGWAPHESQQKPLKPGSATASLEAAVKRTPRE
ncbi:MAG: SAM-dependent methyltransferase [Bradyrhizobium sp.]|nr:SAM-dependent methyltransferase [Bradyrhizobium sp.]